MLRVESSTQPNMGTGVMLLGKAVDWEWLKATIEARLLCIDRFRQRLVQPKLPWGHIYWEEDPDFDLDYHLKSASLPPPGDQAALHETVSLLAATPLDLKRPLWQIHVVRSYDQGSALICRVHHSLADGVALMHVLLSLADADPHADLPMRDPRCGQNPSDSDRSRRKGTGKVIRKGLSALANPPRAADLAQLGKDTVQAVGDLLLSPPDSDTALRGEPTEPKRAAWSGPLPLQDIKTIGRRIGATVNDVLLTAMAGALGRYLMDAGESLSEVGVRALVPISLRPPGTEDELGNRIGIVLLPLPVEIAEPLPRLRELKRRMDEEKHSLEAPLVYAAMQAVGRAPSGLIVPLVDFLCSHATIVVTNVKGPQEQLFLAGAPLEGFVFWTPRYGGIGLGISILSYAGQVRVGAISDKETVPDPESIIAGFQAEFDTLLALALQEPASAKELPDMLDDAMETLDELVAAEPDASEPALEETRIRCRALTKAGHQCKNSALAGSEYCQTHQ
jgi:WS/DGAT/MGAT family acyltransferase